MFKVGGRISPLLHVNARAAFPGLNLSIIAAISPPEIEIEITDESVEPIGFDRPADLVGITAMTNVAPVAYQIADEFRKRGRTVVLGGVHATVCALRHVDSVVVGEAEPVWKELLRDFRSGGLKPIYGPRTLFDMKGYGIPRRDLLKQRLCLFPSTS